MRFSHTRGSSPFSLARDMQSSSRPSPQLYAARVSFMRLVESAPSLLYILCRRARCDIPAFQVVDIYKTYNDGLSKIIRKKLRENGINHHKVVFTSSLPVDHDGTTIGSVAYYPAMCGCVLAGYVINDIIKGE